MIRSSDMSIDAAAAGSGASSGTAPTPPDARPDAGRRAVRALLAVLVWAVAVSPALLGWQQCGFARMLHRPCPGCGMTRAVQLLLLGDWRASLHMHPLAVPMLFAGGAFALSTVWTTYARGAPMIHDSRFGRVAIGVLAVTYVASMVLWVLRWAGYFGGPVAVY